MPHFTLPRLLFLSVLLRLTLFLYGLYQDAHSTLKYTDIDYYVFTDASRALTVPPYSPYSRETYRYTPLLAYLLYPTTFPGFFSSGKLLFAAADIAAGWGIYHLLVPRVGTTRALRYSAATWLLNPMVATISTRGSSEGLLGAMVIALVWAAERRHAATAGALLGLATHFKIYPIIYAPTLLFSLESDGRFTLTPSWVRAFITRRRIVFAAAAASVFAALNAAMWVLYGDEFLEHSYLYHFGRLDHRHNFAPYNLPLYVLSASGAESLIPKLAFVPQMGLAAGVLPLMGWSCGSGIPETMFVQTWAFVAFNKVCTSQYFMWYIVLLPFMLARSRFLKKPVVGALALAAWVGAQAAWLAEAYQLEFEGVSTFFPGLWVAGTALFAVNCWMLGVFVEDLVDLPASSPPPPPPSQKATVLGKAE